MKRRTPTVEEYNKLSREMKYYYDNNNIIEMCECGKPISKSNKNIILKQKHIKLLCRLKIMTIY